MQEIITGKRQNVWRRPVTFNFFFGGAGVGFYVLLAAFGPTLPAEGWAFGPAVRAFIPPILVLLGLLSVATEAGRPLRGLHLFANVRHSWMSREVVFAAIFLVLVLADRFGGPRIVTAAAVGAGILFVLSQMMVMYRSQGVAAWHSPVIIIFGILSSLLNGFGIFLVLHPSHVDAAHRDVLVYGVALMPLTLAAWWGLVQSRQNGDGSYAWSVAGPQLGLGAGTALGFLVPLSGVAWMAFGSSENTEGLAMVLSVLCGSVLLFTGLASLHHLVTGIGYPTPVRLGNTGAVRK